MTCFRASLNVALEWYIIFVTKQWCKLSRAGLGISVKKGPEPTASLSFPNIHPELGICLVGKAHVTKMKLILNFFLLLGVRIPQISYCIFKKSMICIKLITCSAKLSLQAAERDQ